MDKKINEELHVIIPIQHPEESVRTIGKTVLFDWEVHAPELSTIRNMVDIVFIKSDLPSDSIDVETYRRIACRYKDK